NDIDRHVFAKQKELQLNPAPLATDEVFLRRVYLDAIGVLPTAEEARTFLDSRDPDKRSKLIDRLLQRDEYASWWALKWADVLRPGPVQGGEVRPRGRSGLPATGPRGAAPADAQEARPSRLRHPRRPPRTRGRPPRQARRLADPARQPLFRPFDGQPRLVS